MAATTKKEVVCKYPKSVKIGPTIYTVHLLKEDTDKYYGRTLGFAQRIYLNPQMSAASASDTLLHEIIHAIWTVSCLPDRAAEELVASTLGTWLQMVLKDNPEVAAFILDSRESWIQTLTKDPDEEAQE